MAMFSEGGVTSPDIWVVTTIVLISIISVLLNPLVLRHNLRKKKSVARDLFIALSGTDLITSVVVTSVLSKGIISPKEEQFIQDHNMSFCQTDYYQYNRTTPSISEKLLGGVLWFLVYNPVAITAFLAFARWYQISYPLRILSRKSVDIALGLSWLVVMMYFQKCSYIDPPSNPVVFQMSMQIVSYFDSYDDVGKVQFSVITLLICLSTLVSIFTVRNIIKSPAVPGGNELRRRKIKSAMKIAILNAGNFPWCFLILCRLIRHAHIRIMRTLSVFLPILLSSYNPVVYILLTESILKSSSNRGNN